MSPDLRSPVLITWKDHEDLTSPDWQSYADADEQVADPIPVVHSVGWIYHENREAVSLMSTAGPNECSGVLRILKRAIVSRLVLEPRRGTISP
tara:strand:- start:1437 stop:1715 length:279 start_codon:yes stop_codon:yes gene_type:complete